MASGGWKISVRMNCERSVRGVIQRCRSAEEAEGVARIADCGGAAATTGSADTNGGGAAAATTGAGLFGMARRGGGAGARNTGAGIRGGAARGTAAGP